jgi:uncharacterized OB-fold protein
MPRPQPRFPEPDTQSFWDATKEHKLTYSVCDKGHTVFFPRAHCPTCGSRNMTAKESKGEGTIYTYSIVRLNRHPAFAPLVPYAVGYVDLDEGFRIMTNIVDTDVEALAPGQRVKLQWEDQESGVALPLFTRA